MPYFWCERVFAPWTDMEKQMEEHHIPLYALESGGAVRVILHIIKGRYIYPLQDQVSLSLPSLRVDGFSPELMERINSVRKSGLTFAPEAGSQRMRPLAKTASKKLVFAPW